MKQTAHRVFIFFLLFLGLTTITCILFRNFDYYALPMEERPFHDRYEELKPSGIETHGYGIIGTVPPVLPLGLPHSKAIFAMSFSNRTISVVPYSNIRAQRS